MQKNKANETAKDIIKTAKAVFDERINGITLFNVTDEPYKMFSIKFKMYNYFILICNYDRGHFGCSIVYGEDSIALPSKVEWDDFCDFQEFWKEIDEQVRLRIPDKYLQAHGWL